MENDKIRKTVQPPHKVRINCFINFYLNIVIIFYYFVYIMNYDYDKW